MGQITTHAGIRLAFAYREILWPRSERNKAAIKIGIKTWIKAGYGREDGMAKLRRCNQIKPARSLPVGRLLCLTALLALAGHWKTLCQSGRRPASSRIRS